MRRLLLPLLVLPLAACGSSPATPASGGAEVSAVAAFYPLEYAVQRVGGDRVAVEGLTEPGQEPHDLELTVRQTGAVADADLLVHLGGFQPAVDEAAEQAGDRALDVAEAVELLGAEEHGETGQEHAEHAEGASDPHLWLDPRRYADAADAVAARLAEVDPDGAQAYEDGAAALRADLEELDAAYEEGLAQCERRELVVSHEAFGYLADRYDLEQVGIAGLSADADPSPARLAEAARFARDNGVTTVFFETLVSPDVAETVAREVGAETAVLDPVEGEPEDGDYLTAMRANLQALQTGLGCG